MTAQELRTKYLEFFKAKGHAIIPSASLLPENDPTVLFTTAGMHPLVPYLMGETHPQGKRLTDVQKCVRTVDIEEVGDTTHHTFFEMLGNWSLGDYFKQEAIEMSWEFLTSPAYLNLDKNRLAVSVFIGDQDAPFDEEAYNFWKNKVVSESRIAKLGKEDNWWGPAGVTGPCGPDTEMFYWTGDTTTPEAFDPTDKRWVEIWNDVFMQYNKTSEGTFEPLAQKNVDTGMGLERTLAVVNGFDDNYRTELFWPIIKTIEELSKNSIDQKKHAETTEECIENGVKYEDNRKAFRIIADHIKAATFIIGDDKGVCPSNTGQGYVVRRLIRRAIRYSKMIGIDVAHFTVKIAETTIEIYKEAYPELVKNKYFIRDEIRKEEYKFVKTLENGLKELEKMKPKFIPMVEISSLSGKSGIVDYGLNGDDLFNLYATYGFPIELSLEEIKKMYKEFEEERGIKIKIVDLKEDDERRLLSQFYESLKKHQDLSRTASAGMFKGGLADASEETKQLHTAAHLMLEALRRVVGQDVKQKGSNITAERLRFDISHPDKLMPEQIKEVEDLVNEQIKKDLPVRFEEMTLEQARELNATGVFDHKYGEKVKVYFIGEGEQNFSKEICGGPHVTHTGELGQFKITKEESSGAGVRRIKAILAPTNKRI